MKFRATVQLSGKTATGIEVPAEIIERLGQGKRPPVTVTIAGYTYRTTVGAMGGRFMLPLSAENRAAAGVAAGDDVTVEIALDTEPREVSVPSDFATALRNDAAARSAFDKMSNSHKQRWILSITSAKAPETRERRIVKAIEAIRNA
ncbi:MAG TPA: YdeI/OmpD-associated family protein [Streptosporangiaceae bacterium]|nr:YdeI/OmpD-associated family protein [Streptosporangiaceae bacterium]